MKKKVLVFIIFLLIIYSHILGQVSDTLSWVKSQNNPILITNGNGWEEYFRNTFCYKDNNEYKLYYTAMHPNYMEVGLATSIDGINWVKCPSNPVLERNLQNWSSFRVKIGSVLKFDNTYYAFYYGDNQNLYADGSIGMATSSDGINWTQYANNPVINYNMISPGDEGISNPQVIYKDDLFHMLFTRGGSYDDWHYATSSDGINWSIDNNPPINLPIGSYSIRYDGSNYYALKSILDGESVAFFISLDGMNWTEKPSSSLLPYQSWQIGNTQGYFSLLVENDIDEFKLYFNSCQGSWGLTKMGFATAENIYNNVHSLDNIIQNIAKISNYPNPFNPSTTIEFSIRKNSLVELSIYNIKGQKIKNLAKNEYTKGSHSIIWNGDDNNGKSVSSGLYFYSLKVNGKTEAVKKCFLLK